MGGMIAMKVGSLFPSRVLTLVPISATGGGSQMIPWSWTALKYALRYGLTAARSEKDKATFDVKLHYSRGARKQQLSAPVTGAASNADVLGSSQEYQSGSMAAGSKLMGNSTARSTYHKGSVRDSSSSTRTLEGVLVQQYVEVNKKFGGISKAGEKGQLNAIWKHSISKKDCQVLKNSESIAKMMATYLLHAMSAGARFQRPVKPIHA